MDSSPPAALPDCFFYVLTKDDYYCLVNTKCVNQVITGVMRLCLEYGVNGDVDETITQFVENEKFRNPKWYKEKGLTFLTSYKNFDTTRLMEIITKVTGIRHDTTDEGLKSLWQSLREIKNLRNDVMHDISATHSEQTMSLISNKVDEIVNQLGIVYKINSSEIVSIAKYFLKTMHAIKESQQTNEEKITYAIKQSVINENSEKWGPMVTASMQRDKMPFGNGQVLRSDIFHEIEFEVMSDDRNTGLDSGNHKTIVCTDILSMDNTTHIEIIEGDPGSGKTTFIRMMCVEFCEKNSEPKFKEISSYLMMFLINCRDEENIRSFWEYFQTDYKETSRIFPKKHVISALKEMKMIIAIDALDEANEASKELIYDVIHHFASSETIKFLITTRPGFSTEVKEQLDKNYIRYSLLNIRPIENINEQEKFINRVIKHIRVINSEDVMKSFRAIQDELSFHFRRPLGLILFITLFHHFPERIHKLTGELSLMQLSFEMHLQNMTAKMPDVIESASQCSRAVLKLLARTCLQLIQNSTYEFNQKNFNRIMADCYEMNKGIPVESILSCVLLKRKYEKTPISAMRDFTHRSQQEYLASKVLTEQLVKTRSGTVLEILREQTRENVQWADLGRLVYRSGEFKQWILTD